MNKVFLQQRKTARFRNFPALAGPNGRTGEVSIKVNRILEIRTGFALSMNIYLVRHGEAVSERMDPERPLTPSGREQVEQVAAMATARHVHVAAIFHSGILRAKQTAEILATHLQFNSGVQKLSGLLPQDDPAVAKGEIEAAEHPIILVGHLPHLNRLLALLVRGDTEAVAMELAPATMVCCSFDGSKWEIAWTLSPRLS